MNKLLMLGCLLAGLATAGLAQDSGNAERRLDTGTYLLEEPGLPGSGTAEALLPETETRALAPAGPLAELRQRHMADYLVLVQALSVARNQAERDDLEHRVGELKVVQAREELGWLRQDALARGNTAQVTALDESLRNLEPSVQPAPTSFVPRDPVTGRSLTGIEEGGSK